MATGEHISPQQYVRVSDIANEPQKMLMPIRGYEKMPLVSLEEAVVPLTSILPAIQDYVYIAKQRCEPVPADGLTQDESASVMLYSMEWEPHGECVYFVLNETLRTEDRRKLKPWFPYLKLILTALSRLPSSRSFGYRGVNMDLSKEYPAGKTFVWWGFSSCTLSMGILENEQFLGTTGERTMFTIDCDSGKDISRHSYYQSEKEFLLPPARHFTVESSLQPAHGLHMIQLKETQSPISLLQLVENDSNSGSGAKKQQETIVASVLPKTDNVKGSASYTIKELPLIIKETPKYNIKQEEPEFATPGTYKKLNQRYSSFMCPLISSAS